jgi:hypothetical protein
MNVVFGYNENLGLLWDFFYLLFFYSYLAVQIK